MTTAATTTPAEATAYDAMASAFDSLLTPEDTTPIEGDTPAAPAAETTPPAEAAPPVEEAPAASTEGETASEEVAEPVKETVEEDWQARFKELEERVAQRAQPPAPEQPKPPVEAPPPDVYSEDEKTFLKDYAEQWPDIVRGEELRRRDEYRQLVSHIFSEIARVYAPLIERGAQAADTVAETTTLGIIQRAHSDYDDAMYDSLVTWADGLGGTRKRIVQGIIEDGEPAELVELVTEFKQATGRNKPKVVAGTAAPAAQPAEVTELSAKAKQAAKALGVVDSKRTAPASPADPDDFEAAWNEAVGNK